VERLAAYLGCLREMRDEGRQTVSSQELAQRAGSNSAQVRKDLSHLGQIGTPGVGYQVSALHDRLARALGLAEGHKVLLVGVGSLGRALSLYRGFRQEGFTIAALFDNDPQKIGKRVGGLEVRPLAELQSVNRDLRASIGVIAVPAEQAQSVAEALVAAGVKGILNFAPVRLRLPEHISVRAVDLTRELAVLSYNLTGAGR